MPQSRPTLRSISLRRAASTNLPRARHKIPLTARRVLPRSRSAPAAGITRRTLAKLAAAFGVLGVRGRAEAELPDDMALESGVMVPMRDGVRLATDVYRPGRDGQPLPGPFPVILE